MKLSRILVLSIVLCLAILPSTAFAAGSTGFDQYGYNDTARIFNGTGMSWSLSKGLPADYLGAYANDKLIMKWNAAWDACNAQRNVANCTGAWENNEWNGMVAGGSGAVWHYKIVWVGDYTQNPALVPAGGYGIWNEYAVIMDQGKDPAYGPGHQWFTHAEPTGYGTYR